MSQPKVMSDAFGKPLKSAGFKKKKGDTWYLAKDETILVLNLQKSNYGKQYYVNLAVWLISLGDAEAPSEHQCHVRLRWGALIPEEQKRIERLLNLEDLSISDEARIIAIGELLQKYVLPFFSKVGSLAGLQSLYRTNSLPKSCLVDRKAKELLCQRDCQV